MAQQVWVNPARLKHAEATMRVDGVDLHVELSPYSTPTQIVGEYLEDRGRFVITFKYIDDEPRRPAKTIPPGVEVFEGRYSGKLLAIEIPVDSRALDTVAVIKLRTDMATALAEIQKEKRSTDCPSLNADVAEELLTEDATFETLTRELVAT